MSRVVPLYGNHTVVNEYNERVAEKLNARSPTVEGRSPSTVGMNRGMQQLLHDVTIFDPYDFCLGTHASSGALFHVKKELYRLISLVVADLGLIFGVRSPSTWQVISELQTREIISESEVPNINVCLSIANGIRLKTYFANDGQKELLSPIPQYANTAEQCSNDAPFYPGFDEDVVVRLLSTSFDMQRRCQEFCSRYNQMYEVDISKLQNPPRQFSEEIIKGYLYLRLQNFPKALETLESASKESTDYPASIYGQGLIYLNYEEHAKSVECLEKALEAHYQNEEMSNLNVFEGMKSLASAFLLNGERDKARIKLNQAITKHKEIYGQDSETIYLCFLIRRLGSLHLDSDTKLAFECFQKVEEMHARLKGVPDEAIIALDFQIAFALNHTGQRSQAMEYVNKALLRGHKLFGKNTVSVELAAMYVGAGCFYERCNLNNEALSWYERSLEVFRLVYGDKPLQGTV